MSNTSDLRLNYKNIKTGSYINFPDDDLETFIYMCRMLNYNDKRVLNNQIQKLVNVLTNVKIKKKEINRYEIRRTFKRNGRENEW